MTALVKDHIPHKTAKSKDSQPWINNDIRKLIKRRDRLYKKSKKTGNQTINKKYKETKHHVQKLIRKAYWDYIENIRDGPFNFQGGGGGGGYVIFLKKYSDSQCC